MIGGTIISHFPSPLFYLLLSQLSATMSKQVLSLLAELTQSPSPDHRYSSYFTQAVYSRKQNSQRAELHYRVPEHGFDYSNKRDRHVSQPSRVRETVPVHTTAHTTEDNAARSIHPDSTFSYLDRYGQDGSGSRSLMKTVEELIVTYIDKKPSTACRRKLLNEVCTAALAVAVRANSPKYVTSLHFSLV